MGLNLRQNFALVWMTFPFFLAFLVVYIWPALLALAMPLGFGCVVFLLFWQLVIKQWTVFHWNQLYFHVDPEPLGTTAEDYWQNPTLNQVFFQGEGPEEHYDPSSGWSLGILRIGLNGWRHPVYNRSQRLHEIIFEYPGHWKDTVKFGIPGTAGIERKGTYDGAVVDVNNQAFIVVTERTSESVPSPDGKSEEERLRQIPSYRTDPVTHVDMWVPHYIIKRGDGTIAQELARMKR